MAVVRNLMIRIGADFSAARKGMQDATKELNRFKTDTTRTTKTITSGKGLGGISTEFRTLGKTVTSSLSQIRGAKGVGGVAVALGSLRPALGAATSGLRGLAVAAGGASAALGPIGIGIGAITAALALLSAGLYSASQTAAKFEADIGRLNITLREGARAYMDWAQAQGLAKQTAAELGATYGNLLASFISDTKQLQESTQDLVHATRVIASYTGRDIDDVFNRIRSGMLGSTEAIEDLGVYVNISMIESTEAFRKFAGDKSWNQLTFQQQQQIRLAAILEQTYKRYGNQLQQNVMTKQERLLEQFKDVKLHLSQMALPLWDALLPALTRFGEALAWVTEQLARFFYAVRGWDYDEMTRGTNRATGAIGDQADAYDELAESAKTAKKELASFDRLNLLGSPGGAGGGSGSGGTGGEGSGGGTGTPPGSNDPWGGIPPYPPFLNKKYRIEFDKPRPPDAGIGGVATAVVTTVNRMIAETKAKLSQMWSDLQLQTQAGIAAQLREWNGFSFGVAGGIVPAMSMSVNAQWLQMWDDMRATTEANAPAIQAQVDNSLNQINQNTVTSTQSTRNVWKAMLDGILGDTVIFTPLLTAEWEKINNTVSSTNNPLELAKQWWQGALDFMQSKLNAYRPYLEIGWKLIQNAVTDTKPEIESTKSVWASNLANMQQATASSTSQIISDINATTRAWQEMQRAMGAQVQTTRTPAPTTSPTSSAAPASKFDPLSIEGWKNYFSTTFGKDNLSAARELIEAEAGKAENQAALGILGSIVGGGRLAKGATDLMKQIPNLFKGLGNAIPAFASGGIVYGPTLAMVGEYAGAVNNPEIIAPLSDLESMVNNDEQNAILRQILQAVRAGQNIQVTISEGEIARAAINGHNREVRRTGATPLVL